MLLRLPESKKGGWSDGTANTYAHPPSEVVNAMASIVLESQGSWFLSGGCGKFPSVGITPAMPGGSEVERFETGLIDRMVNNLGKGAWELAGTWIAV